MIRSVASPPVKTGCRSDASYQIFCYKRCRSDAPFSKKNLISLIYTALNCPSTYVQKNYP
ncbi:MAG TPA: hypothetical protein ENJ53_03815 [Phaeodactylibacter sp.]|nr:hypothetical protein [Phaeodactylibacter sp.]